MNKDVFLSILALDSYNRGYGANLVMPGNGTALGLASIRPFQSGEQVGWQAAGFYAIAYDVSNVPGFISGGRVISYRGTNFTPGTIWPELR